MAVITLTPASIATVSGPVNQRIAGEAIIQGGVYYIKASDGKAYNAQCDGTAAEAAARGVALVAATAAGQRILGQEGGTIDVGAVLTLGKAYVVSRTAGKVIALDELLSTDRVTGVGYPVTTSRLKLAFCDSGAQVP